MRTAHGIGFKISVIMTYGHIESEAELLEHLFRLRELQDDTGGFYAFIPWRFKPGTSALARRVPQAALPSYYARVIALSRIVLDYFLHIQASWLGEGWRAGQIALHAGADDFGSLLLEEHVLREARHSFAQPWRACSIRFVTQALCPCNAQACTSNAARQRDAQRRFMNTLRIGHRPDPDDAFMFYGFASGQVSFSDHEIVHVLHDIQSLNEMAEGNDPLEVTAMSLHVFLGLEDRYEMLEVGTSVGRRSATPSKQSRMPTSSGFALSLQSTISGGNAKKAVAAFVACARTDPQSDLYLLLLAMSHRKAGQNAEARAAAQKAFALNPDNIDVKHLIDAQN